MNTTKKPQRRIDAEIGERLRRMRMNLALSPDRVAGKVMLGLEALKNYEAGNARFDAALLAAWASALDVKISDILSPPQRKIRSNADAALERNLSELALLYLSLGASARRALIAHARKLAESEDTKAPKRS